MIICSWIRILQCWGPPHPTRAGLGGDWLACLPLSCSPHIKFACEERRAEASTEHGAGHGHCRGMFATSPAPAQPAPASFNMLSNVRRAVETQLFCLKWSCSPYLGRRVKMHKHNSHSDFIPWVLSTISDVVYHFVLLWWLEWNG